MRVRCRQSIGREKRKKMMHMHSFSTELRGAATLGTKARAGRGRRDGRRVRGRKVGGKKGERGRTDAIVLDEVVVAVVAYGAALLRRPLHSARTPLSDSDAERLCKSIIRVSSGFQIVKVMYSTPVIYSYL
jgi:hypothetical protein